MFTKAFIIEKGTHTYMYIFQIPKMNYYYLFKNTLTYCLENSFKKQYILSQHKIIILSIILLITSPHLHEIPNIYY